MRDKDAVYAFLAALLTYIRGTPRDPITARDAKAVVELVTGRGPQHWAAVPAALADLHLPPLNAVPIPMTLAALEAARANPEDQATTNPDVIVGLAVPLADPPPRGAGRRGQRRADGEPSLGGQRRPEPALAIDEQLREPPLSPLHLGEDSAPARPAGDLRDRPTRDPPTTTEDRVGILRSVDDRR
jgi:hypothetical protein